jgi:hypothetical protein
MIWSPFYLGRQNNNVERHGATTMTVLLYVTLITPRRPFNAMCRNIDTALLCYREEGLLLHEIKITSPFISSLFSLSGMKTQILQRYQMKNLSLPFFHHIGSVESPAYQIHDCITCDHSTSTMADAPVESPIAPSAPVFAPIPPTGPTTPVQLIPCPDRAGLDRICLFNDNERCCSQDLSSVVALPDEDDPVLCFEAAQRYKTDSKNWSDNECQQVKRDIESSGGIGCECSSGTAEFIPCAERIIDDFSVCQFLPSNSQCCPTEHDPPFVLPGGVAAGCGIANQTLHDKNSSSWTDEQCFSVEQAIVTFALSFQNCVCDTSDDTEGPTPMPFVLTNPPTPAPTPLPAPLADVPAPVTPAPIIPVPVTLAPVELPSTDAPIDIPAPIISAPVAPKTTSIPTESPSGPQSPTAPFAVFFPPTGPTDVPVASPVSLVPTSTAPVMLNTEAPTALDTFPPTVPDTRPPTPRPSVAPVAVLIPTTAAPVTPAPKFDPTLSPVVPSADSPSTSVQGPNDASGGAKPRSVKRFLTLCTLALVIQALL